MISPIEDHDWVEKKHNHLGPDQEESAPKCNSTSSKSFMLLKNELDELEHNQGFIGKSLTSACFISIGIAFPLAIFALPIFPSDYYKSFLLTFFIVFFLNFSMQQVIKRKIKNISHKKDQFLINQKRKALH